MILLVLQLFACSDHFEIQSPETPECPEFDFDYTSNNAFPLASYAADLTFVGDIFWSRGVHRYMERKELGFDYLFEQLDVFLDKPSVWVGNMECPIVTKQVSYAAMKQKLQFSCRSEYLARFSKLFNVVSLANNHSDNMGTEGFLETKEYLDKYNLQYFGHYDNAVKDDICEVIQVPITALDSEGYPYIPLNPDEVVLESLPMAFCGYHNVFRLAKPEEIKVIEQYAKHFFTVAMPHQGVEYRHHSNKYQQRLYREMIDAGADFVIGAHPHVIQEVELYKGRLIFYSLGNFIFDQLWERSVRQGLVVNMDISFAPESEADHFWNMMDCQQFKDDCLLAAQANNLRPKSYKANVEPMLSQFVNFQPTRASSTHEIQIQKQIGWKEQMQTITREQQNVSCD